MMVSEHEGCPECGETAAVVDKENEGEGNEMGLLRCSACGHEEIIKRGGHR